MTDVELGRPEYAVLWKQARTAVARGQVRLGYKAPDAAAATAVSALLGRELTAGVGTTIAVTDLDARLRAVFHCGLEDVLSAGFVAQAVSGPAAADEVLHAAVAGLPVPWAAQWVDQVRRYAKIAPDRLAALAGTAVQILSRIHLDPAGPPSSWVVRADLGPDLDRGRRLGGVVLRGAALAHGLPLPRSAEEERRLWERCGVLVDGLSTTVLTWAFPGFDDRTAAGLPGHLTIRDAVPAGTVAVVCSSPRVLEEAIAAGVRHPIVCLSGHLNPVARHVLPRLTGARVHCDFDAHGLLIAGQALALTNGTPWRMGADDYRSALELARRDELDLPPLGAEPGPAPWDPSLIEAMRAGWAVPEHLVADLLVDDLKP
ncbi:DUF2399 domain-containing protein [Actinokineospora sp. NBRC 105648]|uniref:DUF2399 domain-containing protein n=1 Tax=Actinokineospora sp. NBRC 105648 TaxID=3032206 RepID=UPI0024A0F91D|nr:DUF2399 domain-containing protein [Actinokineospora sp. NBRC 105648]GLZ40488.1 hypothetical protein Acsp05_41120 [Actinokineospora sp. NBRC 105648]